jgi:hypothetical protein
MNALCMDCERPTLSGWCEEFAVSLVVSTADASVPSSIANRPNFRPVLALVEVKADRALHYKARSCNHLDYKYHVTRMLYENSGIHIATQLLVKRTFSHYSLPITILNDPARSTAGFQHGQDKNFPYWCRQLDRFSYPGTALIAGHRLHPRHCTITRISTRNLRALRTLAFRVFGVDSSSRG